MSSAKDMPAAVENHTSPTSDVNAQGATPSLERSSQGQPTGPVSFYSPQSQTAALRVGQRRSMRQHTKFAVFKELHRPLRAAIVT